MSDYSKMTTEDFDHILSRQIKIDGPEWIVFNVPGVYEIVSEYYNNAVLTEWDETQEAPK